MEAKDIVKGEKYRHGEPDGPIVTVYSIHEYIDNHYYIKYESGSVDTCQRRRLFPLEIKKPWTNHVATMKRYPKKK